MGSLASMPPPAPFYELAGHFAVELPGARAVFTTRRGGGSSGPYASLNLGFSTDDDPDSAARNRATLLADVGAPPAAFMYQIHSAEVRVLDQPAQASERVQVDGQATALAGIAPAALGADCLPIAIAGGGAVAVVHAGWRGLEGGVIAAGVRAVRDLVGDDGAELGAAIGPGAGPCCYEVGPEVHARFADYERRDAATTSISRRSPPPSWRRPGSPPSTTSGCARSARRRCSSPTVATPASPGARPGWRG